LVELTLLLLLLPQPLDKLERVELRKQAEQFVEPGFKLVMQVRTSVQRQCTQQRHSSSKVRRDTPKCTQQLLYAGTFCQLYAKFTTNTASYTSATGHARLQMRALSAAW
jgi:hypothetical protein